MIAWVLWACVEAEPAGEPLDTGADPAADSGTADSGGDTALDTADLPPVDLDLDGFFTANADPSLVDCNDDDPAVTPATERYVPRGEFVRGSDVPADAGPVATVSLSAYCIDRQEVTNAEFAAFLQQREDAGLGNADESGKPLYSGGSEEQPDEPEPRIEEAEGVWSASVGFEDHPVVSVYFSGATLFCAEAGKAIPTEAQWERAARGDAGASYPWGDAAPTCELANHDLCTGDSTPVGTYAESTFLGGFDFAGNVSEWVEDWYDPTGYDSDTSDPTGPTMGLVYPFPGREELARVSRGGNMVSSTDAVAAYARTPEPANGASAGLGFRCARTW